MLYFFIGQVSTSCIPLNGGICGMETVACSLVLASERMLLKPWMADITSVVSVSSGVMRSVAPEQDEPKPNLFTVQFVLNKSTFYQLS